MSVNLNHGNNQSYKGMHTLLIFISAICRGVLEWLYAVRFCCWFLPWVFWFKRVTFLFV